MDELDWIRFIFRNILEFSDIHLQKDVWVLGNKPNYVSSFNEANCALFNDLFFDEFIHENILQKYGIDESLVKEIIKFKDMIEDYKAADPEKRYKDKEIIEDPEWLKVVNQAKKVMQIWEVEKKKVSNEL